MLKRLRSKLTYANVISSLCLFFVLAGGTAFAASQFGKESIPNKALKKESIGPGKLTKAAKAALEGPRGPAGAPGAPGTPGAPGSALAFAHVNANGTLDVANSKNVSASSLTNANGYYCVSPTVPVRNVTATAADTIVPRFIMSSFNDPFTSCPAGAAVIQTWEPSTAGSGYKTATAAFFVVFN